MAADNPALDALRAFLTDPSDANAATLRPHLAEDVVVGVHTTNETGADASITGFQESLFKNVVHNGTWEEAEAEGAVTTQVLTLPTQAIAAGCKFHFTQDDNGLLTKIEGGWVLPPATLEPGPVQLTEAIRARIDCAEDDKMPVLFAFISPDGKPEQVYRSTARTHGEDQLAFWNPRADGDVMEALAANSTINAIYRHSGTHEMLELSGRARVVSDPEEAGRIRAAGGDAARRIDPESQGVAVVIDLDRVNGLVHAAETGAIERISMQREGAAS